MSGPRKTGRYDLKAEKRGLSESMDPSETQRVCRSRICCTCKLFAQDVPLPALHPLALPASRCARSRSPLSLALSPDWTPLVRRFVSQHPHTWMVYFPSFTARKTSNDGEVAKVKMSSGLDFSDGRGAADLEIPLTPPAPHQQQQHQEEGERKNESEQRRLQGLMRSETIDQRVREASGTGGKMSKRLRVWMVNEGA